MLNKSGERENPCFILDLRGKAFNNSSLSMMFVERFFFMDIFIRFGMLTFMIYIPSYLLMWQMNVAESIPLLLSQVEQSAFPPLLDLGLTM